MVRFIIGHAFAKLIKEKIIYIPIWLDLLFYGMAQQHCRELDLHSNMVRFIINSYAGIKI